MKIDARQELKLALFEAATAGVDKSFINKAVKASGLVKPEDEKRYDTIIKSVGIKVVTANQYMLNCFKALNEKRYLDAARANANVKNLIDDCAVLINGLPYDLPDKYTRKMIRAAVTVTDFSYEADKLISKFSFYNRHSILTGNYKKYALTTDDAKKYMNLYTRNLALKAMLEGNKENAQWHTTKDAVKEIFRNTSMMCQETNHMIADANAAYKATH